MSTKLLDLSNFFKQGSCKLPAMNYSSQIFVNLFIGFQGITGRLNTQMCPHNPHSQDLESSHSCTESSHLILRTLLYVLTLKISVFSKSPSNICAKFIQKCSKTEVELKHMLQVSSSSISNILIFLCLHFLIFKCFISSILILNKP